MVEGLSVMTLPLFHEGRDGLEDLNIITALAKLAGAL
jgi:hypothetical protein